ncbi:hypothetical protein EVAR_66644_1 [Eumeta japonica]|uniref:Uncharacterized protein n=1 Tax=Eumeta variegata TaxID=151549 RepID=A0A4C2AA42_EUMVA|nr:hypothetical protein EVAR_66644_1 [Eumeta japonica]
MSNQDTDLSMKLAGLFCAGIKPSAQRVFSRTPSSAVIKSDGQRRDTMPLQSEVGNTSCTSGEIKSQKVISPRRREAKNKTADAAAAPAPPSGELRGIQDRRLRVEIRCEIYVRKNMSRGFHDAVHPIGFSNLYHKYVVVSTIFYRPVQLSFPAVRTRFFHPVPKSAPRAGGPRRCMELKLTSVQSRNRIRLYQNFSLSTCSSWYQFLVLTPQFGTHILKPHEPSLICIVVAELGAGGMWGIRPLCSVPRTGVPFGFDESMYQFEFQNRRRIIRKKKHKSRSSGKMLIWASIHVQGPK